MVAACGGVSRNRNKKEVRNGSDQFPENQREQPLWVTIHFLGKSLVYLVVVLDLFL